MEIAEALGREALVQALIVAGTTPEKEAVLEAVDTIAVPVNFDLSVEQRKSPTAQLFRSKLQLVSNFGLEDWAKLFFYLCLGFQGANTLLQSKGIKWIGTDKDGIALDDSEVLLHSAVVELGSKFRVIARQRVNGEALLERNVSIYERNLRAIRRAYQMGQEAERISYEKEGKKKEVSFVEYPDLDVGMADLGDGAALDEEVLKLAVRPGHLKFQASKHKFWAFSDEYGMELVR
jgi:hypothetical protein